MESRLRRSAASLIEVLVVLALSGLLISILIAALRGARLRGDEVRCLANLRQVGELSQAFAVESHPRRSSPSRNDSVLDLASGILHPQSYAGELEWVGLGAWDYGGGDGNEQPYGESPETGGLGAAGRPLNRMLWGNDPSPDADYSVFQCPSDSGLLGETADAPPSPALMRSVFQARGTSYRGNPIWISRGESALRFCTFMRPQSRTPQPGETVLFADARFPQAWMSSAEFLAGGAVTGTPREVPGWHGRRATFNVVFADGHAASIACGPQGDVHRVDPGGSAFASLMVRGRAGWRVDCFPAPLVRENIVGNP